MDSEVKFRSYSMLVAMKQGDNWYEWCVFLNEDSATPANIRSVKYTLHPTFPHPILRVGDVAARFALFSSGWGGFRIGVNVDWKDRSHTKTTLLLELAADEWPDKSPPREFKGTEAEKVYKALFSD